MIPRNEIPRHTEIEADSKVLPLLEALTKVLMVEYKTETRIMFTASLKAVLSFPFSILP